MFLMLGETVLQMTIANGEVDDDDAFMNRVFSNHACIILSSFIIAWCMMISFRLMVGSQLAGFSKVNAAVQGEQAVETSVLGEFEKARKKEGRLSVAVLGQQAKALNKLDQKSRDEAKAPDPRATLMLLSAARENNVGQELLWEILAVSIMLEGVGVKLALYSPDSSPDAHFAFEQRLALAIPIATVYGTVLLYGILFKDWHHFDMRFRWVAQNKKYAFLLLLAFGLCVVKISCAWAKLNPVHFMVLLSALTLVSTVLLHVQRSCSITSDHPHPLAEIPQVLNAMRITARRARNEAKGDAKDGVQPAGAAACQRGVSEAQPQAPGPLRASRGSVCGASVKTLVGGAAGAAAVLGDALADRANGDH